MRIEFFKSPSQFRKWLERHHSSRGELGVGFFTKASGMPSITYPEALDEALCFGWIDGLRKSMDSDRYLIRFTPRKPHSHWSAVNVRRARALIKAGRMHPSGLKVFEARASESAADYSSERKSARLDPAYEKTLKANKKAWAFFQSKPPSYRQVAVFWVMSAKREETRLRRLQQLMDYSKDGKTIPPLTPTAKG